MQLIIKTLFYYAAMKRTLRLQTEGMKKPEVMEEGCSHA